MGVGVVLYRGPGRSWVRGLSGDVLIVVFLVALLASVPVGTTRTRLVGVGLFAVAAEFLQLLDLVEPDAHLFWHLTLGSTFDPIDLLAYGVGLGVAWAVEGWWARPRVAA